GVEVLGLVGVTPRRRLVHAGHGPQHPGPGQRAYRRAQLRLPVAQVAAQGEYRDCHRLPWTVTATSANGWGIGACGLWTGPGAAPTRGCARQASSSRPARVSMRLTGSPATIPTRRSASSP